MFETLKIAFKNLSKNLWAPTISYVILSAFPLALGIEMIDNLMEISNNSLILNNLVGKFDYAVFSDFWRLNQSKLNPILLKAIWTIPVIWLLKIFISGGNLDAVTAKTSSLTRYYVQCKKYFWRMFRLDILYICLAVILILVFGSIIYATIGDLDGKTEPQIFLKFAPSLLLCILFLFLLALIKDYTAQKIYFTGSHHVRRSFITSIQYVFTRPITILMKIIIYGVGLVWLWVYMELEKHISGKGLSTALSIFFLQQLYVLGKHFLAFWHLFTVQIIQDKRTIS